MKKLSIEYYKRYKAFKQQYKNERKEVKDREAVRDKKHSELAEEVIKLKERQDAILTESNYIQYKLNIKNVLNRDATNTKIAEVLQSLSTNYNIYEGMDQEQTKLAVLSII